MSPIEVFSFSPGSWTGGASSQFILISCKVYNSHLLCSYNTMILWVVMVWSSWRVRGQSALHFDKATKKTRLTSSSSSTSHHHNHHYYTNVSIIIRPSPSSSPTGSLSNDDGDVNENGIKATGLDGKTTTLHVHYAFLYISLSSVHDCDVKMPYLTFCGGHEHKATISFFFSATIQCFGIQLHKKIAKIWRIEWDRISAIKFKVAPSLF